MPTHTINPLLKSVHCSYRTEVDSLDRKWLVGHFISLPYHFGYGKDVKWEGSWKEMECIPLTGFFGRCFFLVNFLPPPPPLFAFSLPMVKSKQL